jgi:hypothetical protein
MSEKRKPVDYSVRDKAREQHMFKENIEHHAWKDRLRKEKEAYNM